MTGAVLAGGRGRRMGGAGKPATMIAGSPLIELPLRVLSDVCERVAVVCKPTTPLPALPSGVARWDEPGSPHHPAIGIAHALARAGEPVLVCAADMPFVTAHACRRLLCAFAATPGSCAVIARSEGRLQPVLGVYAPAAAPTLAEPGDAPLTRLAEALAPAVIDLPAALVRSVNTPAEQAAAERELRGAG